MNNSVSIQSAYASDITSIGEIVAASWQSTFQGILPASFLQSITPEAQIARHARTFALGAVHYKLAERGGETVGFASWGPRRFTDFSMPCELYGIFLKPGFERRGIGRLLFESAREEMVSSGTSGFYLTALTVNPNLNFYVEMGGTMTDAPDIHLGGKSYSQIAFSWELNSERTIASALSK